MSQRIQTIVSYYHEELGKKLLFSYPETQVRQFPAGQLRLKKSEILKQKEARRGKA